MTTTHFQTSYSQYTLSVFVKIQIFCQKNQFHIFKIMLPIIFYLHNPQRCTKRLTIYFHFVDCYFYMQYYHCYHLIEFFKNEQSRLTIL